MDKQMNNEEQIELDNQADEIISDEELEEVSGGRRLRLDELHGRPVREVSAGIEAPARTAIAL